MSGLAFGFFRKEVARKFGNEAGVALTIITLAQFHLPFYMSRTLPNTFALILGTSSWSTNAPKSARTNIQHTYINSKY